MGLEPITSLLIGEDKIRVAVLGKDLAWEDMHVLYTWQSPVLLLGCCRNKIYSSVSTTTRGRRQPSLTTLKHLKSYFEGVM